jgi:hypothetical protein
MPGWMFRWRDRLQPGAAPHGLKRQQKTNLARAESQARVDDRLQSDALILIVACGGPRLIKSMRKSKRLCFRLSPDSIARGQPVSFGFCPRIGGIGNLMSRRNFLSPCGENGHYARIKGFCSDGSRGERHRAPDLVVHHDGAPTKSSEPRLE